MRFFTTLNYSSCTEDWRTERRALAIGPDDRVLAITGGGDRPLNLLLDDPARVTAIDMNPAQTALLRLKMEAMRAPTHEQYLARVAGSLYAGRWERFYRRMAKITRLLRGREIDALFAFTDLEAQRAFVRRTWDRGWWRLVFRLLCSPLWSRAFLGDPAYYAHVDPRLSAGDYLYDAMRASLDRHLARENFMLSLLFRGRLAEEDLPPYLAPATVPAIRARLDRIEVRTAELIAFLESTPERFTRFSLSDVTGFLGPSRFDRLLAAMVRAAEPGARFCIREFLTAHRVPGGLPLRREPALEEELRRDDRAFAWRFIVGTVKQAAERQQPAVAGIR